MHELSIAQGILEIVEQYIAPEQAGGIRSVLVRVGELSGVVPESLEFSFGAIVAGTPWQHAKLVFERVAAFSRCSGCGNSFKIEELAFCCPTCRGTDIQIVSGTELQVVEIETEES